VGWAFREIQKESTSRSGKHRWEKEFGRYLPSIRTLNERERMNKKKKKKLLKD